MRMRYCQKCWLTAALQLVVWPLAVPAWVAYRFFDNRGAFVTGAILLSLVPGVPGQYLRTAYYRLTVRQFWCDIAIGFMSWLTHPSACIGHRVYTGSFTVVGDVTIGDDVAIASRVIVDTPAGAERVRVGSGSWIGESAIVYADVGRGGIVGAGAVTTEAVADASVVAGNPPRVIAAAG